MKDVRYTIYREMARYFGLYFLKQKGTKKMESIIRSGRERKARSFLSALGIVVAIFAFTSLGCQSEGTTEKVQVNTSWLTSKISVEPEKDAFFKGQSGFLEFSKVDEIEAIPGVKAAVAVIGLSLDKASRPAPPEGMYGFDLSRGTSSLEFVNINRGRILEDGDKGKVLLGSGLAEKYGADVGDIMDLHGKPFEVIGVYEPTLSAWDTLAFVCYRDAMDALLDEDPLFTNMDLATSIDVFPEEGVDMEMLSQRIASEVSGIRVVSPGEMEELINAGNTKP